MREAVEKRQSPHDGSGRLHGVHHGGANPDFVMDRIGQSYLEFRCAKKADRFEPVKFRSP